MRIEYKIFRGTLKSWAALFDEAKQFANEIGEENVISISHSVGNDGIVVVWYRTRD